MSWGKGTASRIRLTSLALTILSALTIRAAEGPGEEAMVQLTQKLYAHPAPANDLGPTLFRSLYWLRVTTTLNDLSPTAALRAAYQRANEARTPALSLYQASRTPGAAMYEEQLLADWRIACLYGLFTPENLARLQAGTSPVATDGSFVGQTIEAKKINPAARRAGLGDVALGPQDGTLSKDALASAQQPNFSATLPAAPQPVYAPPQQPAPATQQTARVSTTSARPVYWMPPGSHDMPMPVAVQPSAAVPVPIGPATVKDPPHILLQEVPFNGLMPTDTKVKLGIAGVTTSEISVSIVGVKDDGSGRHGVEVRYYFIDVSITNGTSFRIAKVTGEL